jgi:type II secretory pathway pseudopilin PulG
MNDKRQGKYESQAGFSYIEVVVALVILMVGLLGLLSGLTAGVVRSRGQEEQMVAKHVASSTLESIMSLKETNPENFGWITVGNVGTNPDPAGIARGVFVNGEQDVRLNAGPDNLLGTGDDDGPLVPNMTRQITIVDECDPDRPSPAPVCNPAGINPVRMRSVIVTVRYLANSIRQTESLRTVLTDYARPADATPTPAP